MQFHSCTVSWLTVDEKDKMSQFYFCTFKLNTFIPGMSKIQAGQFAGNNNQGTNSSETIDEFQSRIFGGIFGNDSKSDAFYQRLDRIEKARDRFGVGPDNSISSRGANTSSVLDGLDESFDTLSDGMDGKLKKAAPILNLTLKK